MTEQCYKAWENLHHADFFDSWARVRKFGLKKTYESRNEIRLFCKNKEAIKQNKFFEIGCATGELYRYLRQNHPRFEYYGFDISQPAIARAKKKYPHGNFFVCKKDLSDINGILAAPPSILFAADVIIHQIDPFGFLDKVMSKATEAVILRLRTRDKGASLLDPELACLWYLNSWIPFMILNVDELVDFIQKRGNINAIYMLKSYTQLGGYNSRFLPKDCYYPETGTAETGVYIQFSEEKISRPKIVIKELTDSRASLSILDRIIMRLI